MYILEINNKQYKKAQDWPDITIAESIQLYHLIDKMPAKLRRLYELLAKEQTPETQKEIDTINDGITDTEQKKTFPSFYGKVLNILSTIPQAVINRIDWSYRTEHFYFKLGDGISCESIIIGLLVAPIDFTPKYIESFELDGETLMLPQSKEVLGNNIPLYNEDALTFCESADLELFSDGMAGGRYEWATNLISILCRPKGEQYDEARSLERAKKMDTLTMDIFWEVFFCATKCFNISNANTLTSLLQSESLQRELRTSLASADLDGTDTSYRALLDSVMSSLSKGKTSTTSLNT